MVLVPRGGPPGGLREAPVQAEATLAGVGERLPSGGPGRCRASAAARKGTCLPTAPTTSQGRGHLLPEEVPGGVYRAPAARAKGRREGPGVSCVTRPDTLRRRVRTGAGERVVGAREEAARGRGAEGAKPASSVGRKAILRARVLGPGVGGELQRLGGAAVLGLAGRVLETEQGQGLAAGASTGGAGEGREVRGAEVAVRRAASSAGARDTLRTRAQVWVILVEMLGGHGGGAEERGPGEEGVRPGVRLTLHA